MYTFQFIKKEINRIINKEFNGIPQEYDQYEGCDLGLVDNKTMELIAIVYIDKVTRDSFYSFAEFYDMDENDPDLYERYIDTKFYNWHVGSIRVLDEPIKLNIDNSHPAWNVDVNI